MRDLPITWLSARASGITAYALLTVSLVAGLALKTRPFGRLVKGATAMELHRTLSIAGLVALAVHGVALVLDTAVEITIGDLLIPGTAPYRPLWTGAGVVAGWLMIILIASFRLRRRIGVANWRRLHLTSYAAFVLATAHGVFAGTDTSSGWMRLSYVAAVALVAGALAFRLVSPAPPAPARRTAPAAGPGQRASARTG